MQPDPLRKGAKMKLWDPAFGGYGSVVGQRTDGETGETVILIAPRTKPDGKFRQPYLEFSRPFVLKWLICTP